MKKVYVLAPSKIGTIKPEIYGHFTEHIGGVIYDGIYVGKDSPVENVHGFRKFIIDKLKAINAPVVRWPGGCYAEVYDWRDGVGEDRPTRINWWTRHDKRYESNEVGTHEFVDFCELVGAKPYFAANVTSVSPMHIRNWMDYTMSPAGTTTLAKEREKNGRAEPFDIPYWGIGNENWGGGGNMTPEYYAENFRRFATLAQNAFPDVKRIACGPNAEDYEWTRRFLAVARDCPSLIDGYAMHYYCWNLRDEVTSFENNDWNRMMWLSYHIQYLITRHWAYIQGYGLENRAKLYVDEWGAWYKEGTGPSGGANLYEQQSTMRDALITAIHLNTFNNNCEKIDMANCAQLVNNLHCLFLAAGENCIATPTYHVFDLFKTHMGGTCLRTANDAGTTDYHGIKGDLLKFDNLSTSASVKDGMLTVTIANASPEQDIPFALDIAGLDVCGDGEMTLLVGDGICDHNTFEEPERVVPKTTPITADGLAEIVIPHASVVAIRIPVTER